MSNVVIKAENLSKKYRLGVINRQMLVDQIESWLCRKTGRPDPHAKVFEKATDRMPTPYDFWALKDVSFEIEEGDIIGVMGRNGSGKSTLLKILSRITAPTEGRAFLKGRLASLLEVGTGFNYELTGKENVFLNGSILGLKEREIRARYDQIVEFAEIPDFMDTPVKRYSSGMRVRLAFAVAAHLDPDLLILDEVLAVGDAKFQEKCLNRITEIRNSGVTLLFVSHSAQSVLDLCNKGIVLSEGRVEFQGSAKMTVQYYNQSIGVKAHEGLPDGITEGYSGITSGKLSRMLIQELPDGSVAGPIPLELNGNIQTIDLGWVSTGRLKTLRTEPVWNGAPDIAIYIVSNTRSFDEAEKTIGPLMAAGASEVWVVSRTGDVFRYGEKAGGSMLKRRFNNLSQIS